MADTFKFESGNKRAAPCDQCGEMLADAVDEVLTERDQAWFESHIATCAHCSFSLADARRGAAWLELLKSPRPEPSTDLVDRILAQTGGEVAHGLDAATDNMVPYPRFTPSVVLPFRVPPPARLPSTFHTRATFEPRLMMTAAMAFFSIALTLNLTGVRLDHLRASHLKPASLERDFFSASARVVRFYDNLRVVHVMESRLDDLRGLSREQRDTDPVSQPAPSPDHAPERLHQKPIQQKSPQATHGVSHIDDRRLLPHPSRVIQLSSDNTSNMQFSAKTNQQRDGA